MDRLNKKFKLNLIWIEAKVNPEKGKGTYFNIVDFNTASRNGEPFEAVIKKYGLPSKLYRHCTRELKTVPIHKLTKKILGSHYLTAIGIRADEKHRLTEKENFIYPLAEINIDKKFINDWWSDQDFNLDLKEHEGNCDFCFLKSQKKRVRLLNEGLDVSWWSDMEMKYGWETQPIFDVRNNYSIEDLIELNRKVNLQTSLLDDVSFDCFCKSN